MAFVANFCILSTVAIKAIRMIIFCNIALSTKFFVAFVATEMLYMPATPFSLSVFFCEDQLRGKRGKKISSFIRIFLFDIK